MAVQRAQNNALRIINFKEGRMTRLLKSFEFGNGSRMSGENLAILEFKYLQNKKWQKQAVKSARIKKSYRTYYFHFTQITDKNSQFSFKNW